MKLFVGCFLLALLFVLATDYFITHNNLLMGYLFPLGFLTWLFYSAIDAENERNKKDHR